MSTATILVTGGAGFIGSHSVEHLLGQGHRLRVFDNFSSGHHHNLPHHARLEILHGDIRRRTDVDAAMQGISHCLHLAAQVSVAHSVEDPAHSAGHNILGTINVMHAAVQAGVQRLVHASSAAVYGDPRQLPLDEDSALSPQSPYGLEKWTNERHARMMHDLYGLSSLGLRYFNVYGPRQDPASPYAGVITRFVERLSCGLPPEVFGDGQQTRDFVYVGDVARLNAEALFSQHRGVCNIATSTSTTLLQLLDRLQYLLGTSLEAEFLPSRQEDIRHSCGSHLRLAQWLHATPEQSLDQGLEALIQQAVLPPAMSTA